MSTDAAPEIEPDRPGVNVDESVAVRNSLDRMLLQLDSFNDRLAKIEAALSWTKSIEARVAEFREELGEFRRRLAGCNGHTAVLAASALSAASLSLLEEIVTVLIGRVYADAPREDAEAIEAELNARLEAARGGE